MTGCWASARRTVRRSSGSSAPGNRKILSLTRRSFHRHRDDKSVSAQPDSNDAGRALLALYDQALPIVYGYFVRRCADRGTAEDLTSETFLAAMDAARKKDPPPIAVPWLIGVARHKLADHYRRRHDRRTVPVAPAATRDRCDSRTA
jgi:RNA polymerase sigma-70 factor, ECF subfamily